VKEFREHHVEYGSNWIRDCGNGQYREGPVFTPQGIVHCYADANTSTFLIVHEGRRYRVAQKRAAAQSARGMAITAGRFARQVANGQF
jgi:hypothetical protein